MEMSRRLLFRKPFSKHRHSGQITAAWLWSDWSQAVRYVTSTLRAWHTGDSGVLRHVEDYLLTEVF